MTAATAVAADKATVGQPAPDFEMASTKNIDKLDEPVKLSDYRGKWLVMIFYPLDFTFVCPTELTTFSDRYQDFVDIGADVIGISTDSVYSHRAWINTPRDKGDRKSTRLNSSHSSISYAVFCLKKKIKKHKTTILYK